MLKWLKDIFAQEQKEACCRAEQAPCEMVAEEKAERDTSEDVSIIATSLLFQEAWYRQQYGLGMYVDAARHYLEKGWLEGKNPSTLFSTTEYLAEFPDVQESGLNPLLHFELEGYREGRWRTRIESMREEILCQNPDCREHMEGGFLRVRITNACNAKCRFCGVRLTFGDEKDHAMEPSWYYTHCLPLYEKVSVLLITGGDAFVARESYPYMEFLSRNYPQINVMTESNGIAFDEKFRQLACENLFKTHFSINASNAEVFAAGCWEGAGADVVYPKLMGNIEAYVELLKKRGRLCFAPSVSLVINRDTAEDILPFVRMALRLHAWHICFFFDYTENDMNGDFFGCPEKSRKALQTLMELERVLAGRLFIYFRLWIPMAEAGPMQNTVEELPLSVLQEKYADILELAAGRSMQAEFEERNVLRRAAGKKELRMEEDFLPTIHGTERAGKERCSSPWEALDLSPDGSIGVCCWSAAILNFRSFIENGVVDWDKILNSFEYMSMRKRILQDHFRGCQLCCPLNGTEHPVESVFHYGYERLQEDQQEK